MSDDAPSDLPTGPSTGPSTGLAEIDAVLTQVSAVEDLAVAEHVEVYERAHQQLRHALDAG